MEGIEKLNTKWQIMETEEGKKILTNKLELRIIEIPKAKRILEKEHNNRIAQWLTFIDNPNTERMEKIVQENKEVKKARDVLYVMSEDEKLQRLAELKERALLEELSFREEMEESKKEVEESRKEVEESRKEVEESKKEVEESKKEVEESRKEIEESRKEVEESRKEIEGLKIEAKNALKKGKEQGVNEGKNKKAIEIAKELKKMQMKIEDIENVTGLTKKDIEKL